MKTSMKNYDNAVHNDIDSKTILFAITNDKSPNELYEKITMHTDMKRSRDCYAASLPRDP